MQTPASPFVQVTSGAPAKIDPPVDDFALLSRVAGGDRGAMRALYLKHHVRVYRFLRRITTDKASAEDLTSDVFLEVWRQAARFEKRSSVSTWILGIARYKALANNRHHRKLAELAEVMPTEFNGAFEFDKACLRKFILQRCLTNLPPKHRLIIDLVYYQEKSVGEVASILGIPSGTVKTRMFCARKHLLGMLANVGFDQSCL